LRHDALLATVLGSSIADDNGVPILVRLLQRSSSLNYCRLSPKCPIYDPPTVEYLHMLPIPSLEVRPDPALSNPAAELQGTLSRLLHATPAPNTTTALSSVCIEPLPEGIDPTAGDPYKPLLHGVLDTWNDDPFDDGYYTEYRCTEDLLLVNPIRGHLTRILGNMTLGDGIVSSALPYAVDRTVKCSSCVACVLSRPCRLV
jgi:hypothetical protein